MKYSINLMLWKHDPDEYGRQPIYLSIYIDEATRYHSTGHYINKSDWSKKEQRIKEANANADSLNPEITTLKNSVIQQLAELQVKGESTTAAEVKSQLKAKYNKHNLFDFAEAFIKKVKDKRDPETIENYKKHLRKLEAHNGSKNLNLQDVTPAFLRAYERSLWNEKLSNNYIELLIRTVGMIIHQALDDKIIRNDPFKGSEKYERLEYLAPDKAYLSLPELQRWEKFAMKTTNPIYKQAAIYYLLGCYSGLRISDWFQFDYEKHVIGDKKLSLRIRPVKTGWVTMPISRPLRRVLEVIRGLPLTIAEPTINEKLKEIAKHKDVQINKHLTTHTGRHTFAITICAEKGVSAETCAELMGITVQVCVDNYYKVTGVKIMEETTKAWRGLK